MSNTLNALNKNKVFKILLITFQVALAACFSYMIFTAVKDNFLACLENYPREYREAANLSIARGFLDGKNVYEIPASGPIPIYVYGFVNPLIAAGISAITGLNLLRTFYFISFVTSFAFIILVTYEAYAIVKEQATINLFSIKNQENIEIGNILLLASLFIVTYTLTFRVGHITTIPDNLGMLVAVAILMLTRRSKSWKSVLIISFLVVLEFYIKAYFLFFAAPVFFYFLIKNRKLMGWYMLFCILIGIASIFIINALFPLYFIETIFFEFIEQFLNAMVDETIVDIDKYERDYMISQFVKLVVKYNCVLVVGLLVTIVNIFNFFKTKFKTVNFDTLVYELTIIIAIPLLFVLGKNDGAYMSYHFQLLMPGVLVVAYSYLIKAYNCQSEKHNINESIYRGIILSLIFISSYKSYVAFGKVSLLTKEQEANWEKVEKICTEAYDDNQLVFGGNLVNGVLIDRRSFYTDYDGHTYVSNVTKNDADAIAEDKTFNAIFADLDEMYYYAADYNSETDENFKESKYDIIIADDEAIIKRVNTADYNSETINLDMGQFDCDVIIFTKK